jgi:putative endonuclease
MTDCGSSSSVIASEAKQSSYDQKAQRLYCRQQTKRNALHRRVTSDLAKRAFEHREGLVQGFSARYRCKILIWYELHETMIDAISREKQIKAGSRLRKLALIEELNPDWKDLYDTLI